MSEASSAASEESTLDSNEPDTPLSSRPSQTNGDSAMTPLVAYALRKDPGGTGQGHNTNYVSEPSAVRRLTPRECERLQGFPDDWTALGPDSRRYAALGDAVTVPVAEWIGRRLAA
jgi:DNA (cytosine-5)-methyltransferase 1